MVKRLAEKPAVRATSLLFVRGRLDDPDPPEHKRKPLAGETVNEWWHEAEELVDVPWVNGRAVHGIKRTVTTIAEKRMGSLSPSSATNPPSVGGISPPDTTVMRRVLMPDPIEASRL